MATTTTRQKTHQSVLPQRAALESLSADTVGVTTKRGREAHVTGNRGVAAGSDHGRGETVRDDRRRVRRHGQPGHTGSSVTGGGDPTTTTTESTTEQVRFTAGKVFVLDRHGEPLMPCHPARARQLLDKGRARVARMYPFTIRVVDRTVADSEVDGVVVKLDPGSKATGISVARVDIDGGITGLVAVEVRHRGHQIHQKLVARAALRRGRRTRNCRHRAPRFLNRARPKGWLAPSLQHRVDNVTGWVDRFRRLAPVTGIAMELVRFDTQLLENPNISGVEYQQGTLAGFEVKEYLLEKWGRKCAYCDITGMALNVDHIRPRSRGGSHRISNLTLSCVPCNQDKDNQPVEQFVTDPARLARILAAAKRPLRDAAAVNTTRRALWRKLAATGLPVTTGSGGRTKWNRTRFGLPKSHTLDALAVGDVKAIAAVPSTVLVATSTGRGSYARTRSDRYGFPRLILTRQKRHHGFTTGDLVTATVPTGQKKGTHTGRVAVRSSGSFNITTGSGTVKGISHRHCRLIQRGDGWNYHRQKEETKAVTHTGNGGAFPPRPKGRGLHAPEAR